MQQRVKVLVRLYLRQHFASKLYVGTDIKGNGNNNGVCLAKANKFCTENLVASDDNLFHSRAKSKF